MPANGIGTADIKKLIIEELGLDGVTPESLGDDDPLFGGEFGLDSVDALELVVLLEKQFDITIQSHEVDPQVFSSAASLSAYLNQKTAEAVEQS